MTRLRRDGTDRASVEARLLSGISEPARQQFLLALPWVTKCGLVEGRLSHEDFPTMKARLPWGGPTMPFWRRGPDDPDYYDTGYTVEIGE